MDFKQSVENTDRVSPIARSGCSEIKSNIFATIFKKPTATYNIRFDLEKRPIICNSPSGASMKIYSARRGYNLRRACSNVPIILELI